MNDAYVGSTLLPHTYKASAQHMDPLRRALTLESIT
jgi:hypothetical protein